MLREHEPRDEYFHSFIGFSQTSTSVFVTREKLVEHVFFSLSLSFRIFRNHNKENNFFTLIIKMQILFARAITSTARAIVLCFY